MCSKLWTMALAAALLAPAVQLGAQEAATKTEPNANTRTEQRTNEKQATGADHTIAQCLAIGNLEEIALAKMAVQHSQNPEVKQFAETLIKDHGQMLEQLKSFGAGDIVLRALVGAKAERIAAAREPDQNRRQNAIETLRTAARDAGGLNFVDVKRQVAEKCLQSAEKNWNKHQGAEGDKCYVAQQIVQHQQMLDSLEVLKNYAGPELQAVIDRGISAAQSHINSADKLMKELAQANGQPRSNN